MTHGRHRMNSGTHSRRIACQRLVGGLVLSKVMSMHVQSSFSAPSQQVIGRRPWIKIRGIYGGFPTAIEQRGGTPADFGINAVWVGSSALKKEEIDRCHRMGLKVFAEFNSMHVAQFVKEHPDAAPIGSDGKPCPAPHDWQGVSPFHAGYRENRMQEFRRVLKTFAIDGIWLDYHHAHASWERAEPMLPDTDFCDAALKGFQQSTGIALPKDVSQASKLLLGEYREQWTKFRCEVFTDWVKEYRQILNDVRPNALLGTFHCPWSTDEFDGAIRHKLAIDLPAQLPYLDVFSIMPYHARFGHPQDPAWIARQIQSLGNLLGIKGTADEKKWIWPIVQLADWGETVSSTQVEQILDHATQSPSSGVMVFHWSGISQQWDKVEAMGKAYRAMQ